MTARILRAMAITVRPPVEADLTALLGIDSAYAQLHGLERVITEGALRFFGRTEHSFVAEVLGDESAGPVGFVMAQAVWSGERPQVLVARIATDGSSTAAAPLVKALVKSAYDSGVYDLLARTPAADAGLRTLLEEESFFEDRLVQYVRILGSRGVLAAEENAKLRTTEAELEASSRG